MATTIASSTDLPKGSLPWLQARQQEIYQRQTALQALTEGDEARDLTTEEDTEFNTLEAEYKRNAEQIKRKKIQIERAAKFAEGAEKVEKKKLQKRHSITKVMRVLAFPHKRSLDGVELEMHQEAEREAKLFNREIEGYGIPSFFMFDNEQRDLTAGTAATAGNLIATQLGEMIPYLQPRLQVQALGATMLTGLTSNLDLPRNDGIATATWEGEIDENAETTPTTDKISLTPHRLGAYTNYSKQLLLQSSVAIDNFVASQLRRAIQIKLDETCINGSGTAPIPRGILNFTGIGDVAMGLNGGAPTRNGLIDLENELAVDDADMGALAFLTTPTMRAKLKKTATDAGSGLFVWAGNELVGYRAVVSTQVPSTLTKGTSTDCHAIIFGNWSEFLIGQWGGLDLVVDPYTKSKNSEIVVVANSWWDTDMRHAASFAAIQDARNV